MNLRVANCRTKSATEELQKAASASAQATRAATQQASKAGIAPAPKEAQLLSSKRVLIMCVVCRCLRWCKRASLKCRRG